jgi:hypothetical protein
MNIHIVDSALIARGRQSFRSCVLQYLGNDNPCRESGVGMIPGAIVAAIEMGIVSPEGIAKTVGRVTRCWDTTVGEVLETLEDPRVEGRLWAWCDRSQRYHLVDNTNRKPITIMTN